MTPGIRLYDHSDRAACALVFFHAVREGAAAHYSKDHRKAWAPSETPDLQKPDKLLEQYCWVAEFKDKVIGFMSLTTGGYLDMAFVLPAYKGRGVANALYSELVSKAKSRKMKKLTVHASHHARPFFTKHGWQVENTEDHAAKGLVFQRFHMSVKLSEDAI